MDGERISDFTAIILTLIFFILFVIPFDLIIFLIKKMIYYCFKEPSNMIQNHYPSSNINQSEQYKLEKSTNNIEHLPSGNLRNSEQMESKNEDLKNIYNIQKEQLYNSLANILKKYAELKETKNKENISKQTSKIEDINIESEKPTNISETKSTEINKISIESFARPKYFDLERFARECNEYLRKQDMEERYENQENASKKQNIIDLDILKNTSITNKEYDSMDGHQFEYFCADILRKNGFERVAVTQGSGDQGIDIIAFKDGIKYGVQCKCYSSDIGNKAVQEAFSGKAFYNCHVGVVLTNRYFTAPAKELAEKNGILLWDRNKLNEMIGKEDNT